MEHPGFMSTSYIFDPPLVEGTLVRRYKRFLADVTLLDGRVVTAHCMNTGSMTGLANSGSRVWLSPQDNPKRKLKYSWEIASDGEALVGVNTLLPNALVRDAIAAGNIPSLRGYGSIKREVRYGERSRVDLLLSEHDVDPRPAYVEIKNVTLACDTQARFPDAVTLRGRKHLHELMNVVAEGARAVIFFLVQREGVHTFAPADSIDPDYGESLRDARQKGVEVEVWQARVTPQAISILKSLPTQF